MLGAFYTWLCAILDQIPKTAFIEISAALWPTFSRNPLDRFWICFANRKCVRPAIDPENLTKIAIPQFEQISLKVGKKSLFHRQKYSKSHSRYNGLMLKFAPGGAVTVRDRPPDVYEVE